MKRTEEEKRLNARIGGNVRRRRAEKGMSQAELVEALVSAGVTLDIFRLSRIEYGIYGMTVSEMIAFSKVLDMPFQEIMR